MVRVESYYLVSCLDNGSCYFEPVLKAGASTGKASLYKIRDAASEMITKCGLRENMGGIVNNLG